MTLFQYFGLTLIAVLAAMSLANLIRYRSRARVSLFWLLLWVAAGAALIHPRFTLTIARAMGIGRGADLVFYFNVLATLIGFFVVYMRQRRLERQLTILVRELALVSPFASPASGTSPSSPDVQPDEVRS
jgi:small membrane protein